MKKLLSQIAICFLLLASCYTFILAPRPTYAAAPAVPILMYHYIRDYHVASDPEGINLSVAPALFAQQMQYLATHGYTPITLDTLAAIFAGKARAPAKPIVLTFDDGYKDFFTAAFPILKLHHFHAVSFVITGFVGEHRYLSWKNIKEMQASGLIAFESHTVHHTYLPAVSYQQALDEVVTSKKILQSETGAPVNFIAYPDGATDATVERALQKAGYIGALGEWFAKATVISLDMPRVRIPGGISLADFALRVQ
jgi:peptidoglycan/xylan/chitin deacetylase (PgdA/CDA1 family)